MIQCTRGGPPLKGDVGRGVVPKTVQTTIQSGGTGSDIIGGIAGYRRRYLGGGKAELAAVDGYAVGSGLGPEVVVGIRRQTGYASA